MEWFVVLAGTALIMAAEHYAAAWYTGGRLWPRLVSYTLGLLGVLAPVSLWLFWHWWVAGEVAAWRVLAVLWSATAVAGATVAAMYLVDGWVESHRAAQEARAREEALLGVALGADDDADAG